MDMTQSMWDGLRNLRDNDLPQKTIGEAMEDAKSVSDTEDESRTFSRALSGVLLEDSAPRTPVARTIPASSFHADELTPTESMSKDPVQFSDNLFFDDIGAQPPDKTDNAPPPVPCATTKVESLKDERKIGEEKKTHDSCSLYDTLSMPSPVSEPDSGKPVLEQDVVLTPSAGNFADSTPMPPGQRVPVTSAAAKFELLEAKPKGKVSRMMRRPAAAPLRRPAAAHAYARHIADGEEQPLGCSKCRYTSCAQCRARAEKRKAASLGA